MQSAAIAEKLNSGAGGARSRAEQLDLDLHLLRKFFLEFFDLGSNYELAIRLI